MFDSLLFYQVYIYRLCESPLCPGFKLLHYYSNKTHIYRCINCVNMFTFLRAAGLPVEMPLICFSTGIRRIFWHDICRPVQCHTYACSHVIPIPMFRYYLHVDTMLADLGSHPGLYYSFFNGCWPLWRDWGGGQLDSPPPLTLALLIGNTHHVCICLLSDCVSCFNHSHFTMLVFDLYF